MHHPDAFRAHGTRHAVRSAPGMHRSAQGRSPLSPAMHGREQRAVYRHGMALPSLARVPAPPDPILGLAETFRSDPREGKINLSSGVFVDESGTTPVLQTVIEAERRLAQAAGTKLYRPIDG